MCPNDGGRLRRQGRVIGRSDLKSFEQTNRIRAAARVHRRHDRFPVNVITARGALNPRSTSSTLPR